MNRKRLLKLADHLGTIEANRFDLRWWAVSGQSEELIGLEVCCNP